MIRNVLVLIAGCLTCCSCTGTRPETQVTSDSAEQDKLIRDLIEQLVFAEGEARNEPIMTPGMVVFDAQGNAEQLHGTPGYHDSDVDYEQSYKRCQEAYRKLADLQDDAIPILVEHLDDQRQSINFRNHYLGNSVGHACRWIIYDQLQDTPGDYSFYGYSRKGRDGKQHPKPYYEGTPFDSEGGMKLWLEKNSDLSYAQKQIKCLEWLLEKEKAIGVCDAESYFINILPLEIRILERKLEAGESVEQELEHLREVKEKRLVNEVPAELLPVQNQTENPGLKIIFNPPKASTH